MSHTMTVAIAICQDDNNNIYNCVFVFIISFFGGSETQRHIERRKIPRIFLVLVYMCVYVSDARSRVAPERGRRTNTKYEFICIVRG